MACGRALNESINPDWMIGVLRAGLVFCVHHRGTEAQRGKDLGRAGGAVFWLVRTGAYALTWTMLIAKAILDAS